MKRGFRYLLILLCMVQLSSCNYKEGQPLRRNVTGKAGGVLVVMSDKSWDDIPGNLIRKTFGQPQLALPQEEPILDITRIPNEAFKDVFLTTRNILQTRISPLVETSGVVFYDNVWAYPQATVQINARNNEEFEKLFNENSDKLISYFLKAERQRLTMNYRQYHERAISSILEEKYDLSLQAAPGFQLSQERPNFVWLRFETPEISQGLLVYWFPYQSDSTFTPNYLLAQRDSFLKANVPGPTPGSFMGTERRIDPLFQITTHNGNYAAEMRGLWRVENDFMGGPYLMLAELDACRKRVVVVDGYVYAPSKEKRNLLRQGEAMVYSLRFKDQEKNDKINSQIKMGN